MQTKQATFTIQVTVSYEDGLVTPDEIAGDLARGLEGVEEKMPYRGSDAEPSWRAESATVVADGRVLAARLSEQDAHEAWVADGIETAGE